MCRLGCPTCQRGTPRWSLGDWISASSARVLRAQQFVLPAQAAAADSWHACPACTQETLSYSCAGRHLSSHQAISALLDAYCKLWVLLL